MENKKPIHILYKKRSLDKKSQYWTQFSITHRIFLGIKSFSFSRCKDQSTTITWSGERLPNQYFSCFRIYKNVKNTENLKRVYDSADTSKVENMEFIGIYAF